MASPEWFYHALKEQRQITEFSLILLICKNKVKSNPEVNGSCFMWYNDILIDFPGINQRYVVADDIPVKRSRLQCQSGSEIIKGPVHNRIVQRGRNHMYRIKIR